MSVPAQPDKHAPQGILTTYNDPRVPAHGRVGELGAQVIWVDSTTGRAYPMVKQGVGLNDWEPVYTVGTGGSTSVSATSAAQSVETVDTTIQVLAAGRALAAPIAARVWISDVAGGGPTAAAPSGGVSIATGTVVATITANKVFDVITNATGVAVVRMIDAGALTTTWYVNVLVGGVVFSKAVAIENPGGALVATLAPVTVAATGTVAVTGALTKTLATITGTRTGTVV